MSAVVADTHALVWFFSGHRRLSVAADQALQASVSTGHGIYVPTICLVELTYLIEKGRLPPALRQRLNEMLDDPDGPLVLAPLDRRVAAAVESISRKDVPDMPDRIIAATAMSLQVPLVSCDLRIRASQLQTIW